MNYEIDKKIKVEWKGKVLEKYIFMWNRKHELTQANLRALMYGPQHASMNDTANERLHQGTTRIAEDDDEDDVVQCSNGDDAIDNAPSQIRYDPPNGAHSPHALAEGSVLEAVDSHALYAPDMAPPAPVSAVDAGADQLTLSFQGEVYVFDSVSPEKV